MSDTNEPANGDSVTPRYSGRAPNGTFARGNQAAKGNPAFRRMMELRKSLLEAADSETVQALFRKLAELGLAGDVAAIRLYLEYACGRATQPVELSGPESTPLFPPEMLQALASNARAMELACELDEILLRPKITVREDQVELRRILDGIKGYSVGTSPDDL